MLSHIVHAASAVVLCSLAVHGMPVEHTLNISFSDAAASQFHPHSLDHMNLTAIEAWNPTASVGKRQDREAIDPSVMIGRIEYCKNDLCGLGGSAALVGPRHILTARHATVPEGSKGVFFAGYDHRASSGHAFVEHTYTVETDVGPCRTKHDFAVMVLSERLGDSLGTFGVVTPDSDHFNQPIFSTRGYPARLENGEQPIEQTGISLPNPWKDANRERSQLECDATGPIFSDNKATEGQSGSPLWDDYGNIWGVLSIGIDTDDGPYAASGWASGDAMLSSINQALEDYP